MCLCTIEGEGETIGFFSWLKREARIQKREFFPVPSEIALPCGCKKEPLEIKKTDKGWIHLACNKVVAPV